VRKFCIGLIVLGSTLVASEPSVFEAGNLEAKTPYGLSKEEKYILKNKQDISSLQQQVYRLGMKVNKIEETIDGMKGIIEGIEENIQKLRKEIKVTSKKAQNPHNPQLEQEMALLRRDLNQSLLVQKENFAQMKKTLKELTSIIDNINKSYVSKQELQGELEKLYKLLNKRSSLESKSGAQLYKEGRKAFRKQEFLKAKEYFEVALKKRYKPAASNFYIGESCYYTKNYGCAVEHYKKSASLYSKASYMPTLLLHTAISLDRLGEKEEAKKFYESVIKLYPKSKAASLAKKYSKSLK